MNNFNLDITRKVLIGQGWVPDVDIEPVKAAIAVCCVSATNLVHLVRSLRNGRRTDKHIAYSLCIYN